MNTGKRMDGIVARLFRTLQIQLPTTVTVELGSLHTLLFPR